MRITILQFSNGAFCANRNVTATGGSWPAVYVRGRARKLTFDARAWPAKVSCQRSPGTHTDGQFQTFASGSYRRRQLTTVAVYRASFAQASLAAEGRARSLRNAQPVAYFPSQNG